MRPRRLATVGLVALAGCSSRFGAPDPASRQGDEVASLWRGTVIAALVVGGLVLALIVYALVRYRRRSEVFEEQESENVRIELLYTLLPVVVVAGLFFFTVRTERDVNHLQDTPPALIVEVLAFQWQWQFTYLDAGVQIVGVGDEAPELVLPVDSTVRLELVAEDVVHAFWVPRFLYKRDVIPGIENVIDVDPTEVGTFPGACAEFCGLDHADMRFVVRVLPVEEFEQWLAEEAEAQDQ